MTNNHLVLVHRDRRRRADVANAGRYRAAGPKTHPRGPRARSRAVTGNLSAEVTSFVVRRQELREVKRLLTTTRLLTLTGSRGAGKAKLALRAAADMSRGFPDGAWLAQLDSARDPCW